MSGNLVRRQRNVQSDPIDPNGHARIKNSVPLANDYGQVMRVAPIGLIEAIVNFSSAGDHNVIGAPGAGQFVKIWKVALYSNGDQALSIRDGSTPLMGSIDLAQGGSLKFDKDSDPWFSLAENSPFNLNTSQAVQLSGRVYYTQGAS